MKLERKDYLKLIGIFVATLIIAKLIFKNKNMPETIEKTWDAKTDAKIQTLHPILRAKAAQFINAVEKKLGKRLKITDGLRTFAEQDALYAKGRTTSGSKVTNAKGGQSYHNYGLAFDCYFTKDGKVDFSKPINAEVAKVGQELGLEWGGVWKSLKDFPHFQLTKGTISQLYAIYKTPNKKDSAGYIIV